MFRSHLKIAFKVLLRRKFFTFISLFGISFTLLVVMVAAAFLDHMYGAFPPETRSDRTLGVYHARMSGPSHIRGGDPGYLFLDRYIRTLPGVERVSIHAMNPTTVTSYKDGEPVPLALKRTDGEFWRILEFQFLEGGPYSPEDEAGASFVAVINEATRAKLLGSGPAVGRTIEAGGQRFRVVGVVPNVPIYRMVPYADVWVPISTSKSDGYKRELLGGFVATILAKRTEDMPAIKREIADRAARVEIPDPKSFDRFEARGETLFESTAREIFHGEDYGEGRAEHLFALLAGLAGLFMALPAINLVNVNVSRILERAPEIGVRKAFGASRRALVGQFVLENVALCLAGGAISFVLSYVVLRAVSASGIVPYADFRLNGRIFLYGLAAAVFFGVASGLFPAWRMSRLQPTEALRGRTR